MCIQIREMSQDSGLYQCIIRNSKRCYKYSIPIAVLNNSASLCFNKEYYLKQNLFPKAPSRIVCHQVNEFGQEVDYSSIHWYKECKPIQGERFEFFRNHLIMKDIKKDDGGKYVCKGTYTFKGNKYNFSNSILVTLLEKKERKRPEILYPINNTIEADIGSSVFTECNVSSFKDTFISISWRVNNTLVDDLFKGRIQEGNQTSIPKEGTEIFTVSLNITELKNEDYDQHFICHAGEVAAYIKIQRPTKNHTAFVLLILLLIIPVLICILFKIEIVLWYRKSCRSFLHKKVSDGKIYDAYVLYPKISSQIDFVLKVLPDVLEKQCEYSLFIPGRDDLPGKALVNVVDEAIGQSRRLIMILVPGLSSSEEAPEQNIAVYHALIPDGMKTILIEMTTRWYLVAAVASSSSTRNNRQETNPSGCCATLNLSGILLALGVGFPGVKEGTCGLGAGQSAALCPGWLQRKQRKGTWQKGQRSPGLLAGPSALPPVTSPPTDMPCPELDLIARKVSFRVESICSFPPKPRLAGLLPPPLLRRCSGPGGGGASRWKEEPWKLLDLGAQVALENPPPPNPNVGQNDLLLSYCYFSVLSSAQSPELGARLRFLFIPVFHPPPSGPAHFPVLLMDS
ncbi:interleukin-1 receptor-like 2 [Crotalus adamanteus]|uniref:Interleukin-1 receptor-like 2 n=1 Tax=Crotalus adamanteus TaxID=8729 RepID=A0AAW1BIA3_CROAD